MNHIAFYDFLPADCIKSNIFFVFDITKLHWFIAFVAYVIMISYESVASAFFAYINFKHEWSTPEINLVIDVSMPLNLVYTFMLNNSIITRRKFRQK